MMHGNCRDIDRKPILSGEFDFISSGNRQTRFFLWTNLIASLMEKEKLKYALGNVIFNMEI
jgi:hypothetical protein